MKTIIIVFLACLLINPMVNGQTTTTTQKKTTSASPVQLGIKAGVNIANLHSEDDSDFDSRTGFHGGLLAHIHLSDNLAVQPELVYSMQGNENSLGKNKLDYLNIPLMIQYMAGDGFRIQAGPQVGFLVSAKSKIGNVEENVKRHFESVDFSVAFGLGFLSNSGLGIDARYNLGLSNINENESAPKLKNRVWQIGLFYQFMQ
jgi:hypothetical protein